MKLNKNCVKAILNYVEENYNLTYDKQGKYFSIKRILFSDLMTYLVENEHYTEEEVFHSFLYADKFSLIKSDGLTVPNDTKFEIKNIKISDLTSAGYHYLEEIN